MSKKILNFLVLEDDDLARLNLVTHLKEYGLVRETNNSKEAIDLLSKEKFDIAWIDLDLETELAGLKVIQHATGSNAYAVVLSGREEDEYIEKAYELGCDDYLSKPFDKESLLLVLRKYRVLKSESKLRNFFSKKYITQNEKFIKSLQVINEIIGSDKPIFIKGETGTGKTLISKLIHEILFESMDKFIHLNCSEIPENLLESELFGYEKGAFSGAETSKKGKLELADGGTLFLDEIATMPISTQKKLLKAIDEKTFYPLGSEKERKSNFRLMSATCEDLEQMVKDGRFREDLYFRIEGFNVTLPNLVERKGDIPLLIKHLLGQGKRRIVLSSEVKNILENYSWPGNIRELKKVIEVLQSKCHGVISKEDLPIHISGIIQGSNGSDLDSQTEELSIREGVLTNKQLEFIRHNGLKAFMDAVEEDCVNTLFEENDQKVRQTLSVLKISNSSFYRITDRIKKAL
ncbi:sigma-54 dependent transcriptional regulator [Halobacteriovorax sp. HLS]|uniref:sigma-54-dependent transcriptional regulator n=1 Tax=Halobacteriovorax sp. HLS TaxID=2234000 RepID=UPI000FD7F411|nr:sigma-54 dependent transcriptional regulator [Halobacteriovorax sp. HLS]